MVEKYTGGGMPYWHLPEAKQQEAPEETPEDVRERVRRELNQSGAQIRGGVPMHFNRKGEPIGLGDWSMLLEDPDYKIVKRSFVGRFGISTVWLGLDHGFGGRRELFEAMVCEMFPDGNWTLRDDLGMWRYATEEEALSHHEELLSEISRQCGDGETNVEPQLWGDDDEDDEGD